MNAPSPLVVGCFEITEVSQGRWKVKNTLTDIEHVTYGTEEEVRAELSKQSDRWKVKFSETKTPRLQNVAWKGNNPTWKKRT